MKLTGARVKLVQQCSGIDGMWGLRAENADAGDPDRREARRRDRAAGGDVVAGDCHLANTAITEQTGLAAAAPAAGDGPGLRHPDRGHDAGQVDGGVRRIHRSRQSCRTS